MTNAAAMLGLTEFAFGVLLGVGGILVSAGSWVYAVFHTRRCCKSDEAAAIASDAELRAGRWRHIDASLTELQRAANEFASHRDGADRVRAAMAVAEWRRAAAVLNQHLPGATRADVKAVRPLLDRDAPELTSSAIRALAEGSGAVSKDTVLVADLIRTATPLVVRMRDRFRAGVLEGDDDGR